MIFFAYHGARRGEAEDGQRFEVDVELCGDLSKAAKTDNLEDTYDYDHIYNAVNKAMTTTRFNLIETIAEEIAHRILTIYPSAKVTVAVRKPHVSVTGVLDFAEVEICRSKDLSGD